eukprot:CAMPEP_0114260966 /NCGR_PEP_ID=MMETSP0058-20121206/20827_1 /TAXON_ID=36894 /ORGANISM="Pyramimonas parkeae, CCMP726" /LENGTH=74 /DNA_ID=CAMNT_0001376353 /DNA_START=361 /DNA_END=581 /DNA_ORIENTATION=+
MRKLCFQVVVRLRSHGDKAAVRKRCAPWPYALVGTAQQVAMELQHVRLVLGWKQRLVQKQLAQDASDRPHVNRA